jgi:AAA+ ATPase superfamily predicted ATPase
LADKRFNSVLKADFFFLKVGRYGYYFMSKGRLFFGTSSLGEVRRSHTMDFLGRDHELEILREELRHGERGEKACLSVLYGRRRIGKTRLVEEAYRGHALLKFEGLERQPTREQQRIFLERLAELSGRPEVRLLKTSSWTEILMALAGYLSQRYPDRAVGVFFDEFPWMAAGRTKLVSDLKYVWDNYLSKNKRIHLILCGSTGSFLLKEVVRSQALYGRVGREIHLKPLELPEIRDAFRPERSLREVVELYMALGGVPQYLEMIDPSLSARANIENLCFSRSGLLTMEFERVFASHFGSASHFRSLLFQLAMKGSSSRDKLARACGLSGGGRIAQYLEDLELAGFVERYAPADRPDAERLVRFRIADPYVLFYFRFIRPALQQIQRSRGRPDLMKYVSPARHATWQGLAFERLCCQHAPLIAEKLGFGSVRYTCGPWFSRDADGPGSQIDLLFVRADRVLTVCEVKFQDEKVGKDVTAEVEAKVKALPNRRRWTVEKVLISASGVTEDLARERYFSRVLELEDLFAD